MKMAAEAFGSHPSEGDMVFLPLTQASSLPGKYLHDQEIYREEWDRISLS
jgi:hypothetical protein